MGKTPLTPQELDSIRAISDALDQPSRSYRRGHWAWLQEKQLQSWDPVGLPASWMTWEIEQALAEIEDPHARKKRCTVLRMAQTKANGLPVRSVFEASDTCTTQTWYGRSTEDPGWKDDPKIKRALELAEHAAQQDADRAEAQAMALQNRQLQETRAELIDLTRLATQTLADLMMNASSERVRREAAEGVLDRAAEETARKVVQTADLTFAERKGPTMAEISKRHRHRPGSAAPETIEIEAQIGPIITAGEAIWEFETTLMAVPGGDGSELLEWVSDDGV